MRNIITFILLVINSFCYGQLVNIETRRMQTDSVRFAMKGDVLFNYTKNNSNYIYNINTGITTQLKSKDLNKTFFLLGNYGVIRSKDQDYRNSWLIHFRYNHEITNLFRIEGFFQNQNNELLVIDSRNLIGVGTRLKFISKKTIKAYLGNSYMYEIEKSDTENKKYYNHRHNSYLSFTISLANGKLDLVNTIYFQPLYNEIGNHRVLEQLKMEIPISDSVSFSGLYNYFYMSRTPALRTDRFTNISFGFSVSI